jgi:hypothetical protein
VRKQALRDQHWSHARDYRRDRGTVPPVADDELQHGKDSTGQGFSGLLRLNRYRHRDKENKPIVANSVTIGSLA